MNKRGGGSHFVGLKNTTKLADFIVDNIKKQQAELSAVNESNVFQGNLKMQKIKKYY